MDSKKEIRKMIDLSKVAETTDEKDIDLTNLYEKPKKRK